MRLEGRSSHRANAVSTEFRTTPPSVARHVPSRVRSLRVPRRATANPTRGPPPLANRPRYPPRGDLPWTRETNYRRARWYTCPPTRVSLDIDAVPCRILMTIPVVGPVVALTPMSAIDNPGCFRRSKGVGPWVGPSRGRNQSGERDIVGQITKAGDSDLRTAFNQAATVMLHYGALNWLNTAAGSARPRWIRTSSIPVPCRIRYENLR